MTKRTKRTKWITPEGLRKLLEANVNSVGAAAWMAKHDISPTWMSLVINGKRPVPEWVAEMLGYRRVTTTQTYYEKIEG